MGYEGTLIRVEVDRPAPGEELNTGTPTEPRPAATVIVLRGGDERLEVLLVQRNPNARFMPGAWVFPGGALDGSEDARTAGVREVEEEARVKLPDPALLVPFSRWITPAEVKIRFDTLFLLAPAPPDAEPRPDGGETVGIGWHAPQDALAAFERGEMELVFPTIKTLEQLSRFAAATELLTWAEGRTVEPVVPQVIFDGEVARIVLPGEPGYRD
jgi:8-oxo-dGTP pyrophosphatase MutT (NUDIX family)